jgi:predicted transcriptional regulator
VSSKQAILKAIADLPEDASVEDALERLYLLYKIERGTRQADRGELIGQEEARRRMAQWLTKAGRPRLSTTSTQSVSSSPATLQE